jgi:hypothetical protein
MIASAESSLTYMESAHHHVITGPLVPSTTYYFVAGAGDSMSPIRSFTSPPLASTPIKVASK